jgi:hypothetical protein
MIRQRARELIDQIPQGDRAAIKHLALYGIQVLIRWTDLGWRYDVTLP